MFGDKPDIWSFIGYVVIISMAVVVFIYNNKKDKSEAHADT